jgi:hypothetical protein
MCPRRATPRLSRARRAQFAWTLCGLLLLFCSTTVAAQKPAVAEGPLAFFAGLRADELTAALESRRPPPISLDDRNKAIAGLPHDGIVRPVEAENAKLQTMAQILRFHERIAVVDVELVDVEQAFVGLHARSILLISRRALRLVSSAELQGIVAHEIGHDYFWDEYQRANERNDTRTLRDVELKCDGIAALTLVALGLDPRVVTSAARKLTRFNEELGATANLSAYPSARERERFVRTVLALRAQPESRRGLHVNRGPHQAASDAAR